MGPDDRAAIEALFDRLAEAERRGAPRDPQADALIAARLAEAPWAAYRMLQTIEAQTRALEGAQARLAAAEQARDGGGLFGGLFGSRPAAAPPPPREAPAAGGRGGFLADAAQTAVGVAGGMLIADALSDWLSDEDDRAAGADPQGFDDPGDGDWGGDEI